MEEKQMPTEKEVNKVIESLSEEDLQDLASGKLSLKAKEQIIKYSGIGFTSGVPLGLFIAAAAGKIKHEDWGYYYPPYDKQCDNSSK